MLTADELLRDPLLKLERARHHINDFNMRAEEFLAERPAVMWELHERKAGRRSLFVKHNKPIPPEFSLVIGDAAHNLRAALDWTLFQMARDKAPKPDRIQFPFVKDDTPRAEKMAFESGQVGFAGKKVVEEVRKFQPYPAGNFGLYLIHLIDIQDKHRLPVLAMQQATIKAGTPSEVIVKPLFKGEPMKATSTIVMAARGTKNDPLITFPQPYATRDLPDSENEAKVQPTFVITFEHSEALPFHPVTDVFRVAAEEAERAIRGMVAAYLDPDNTFPD